MLPSIKSALIFDTFIDTNGIKYVALYKGDVLAWESQGKVETSPKTKGSKGKTSSKYPSKSASSVEIFTVMQGNDGNSYIALYDDKGKMSWQRHQTKYTDMSCVVTHIKTNFDEMDSLDCIKSSGKSRTAGKKNMK